MVARIVLTINVLYGILGEKSRSLTMTEVQKRDGLYGFEYLKPDERRVDPGERKAFNIKALWQLSHEILNLAALGFKHVDIAKILNISPATVSNTVNSELGKMKISELRRVRDDEVKVRTEKIRVLTDKALNVYHEIFDSDLVEMDLKRKAADTVSLKIGGLEAPTKIMHANYNVSKEDLEEFKARGRAVAESELGIVIDVEPEEVQDECASNGQ